jgi:hypothetical protein
MTGTDRPEGEHPRGTLALVGLYAALFLAGWFAIYIGIYLARGPVTQ